MPNSLTMDQIAKIYKRNHENLEDQKLAMRQALWSLVYTGNSTEPPEGWSESRWRNALIQYAHTEEARQVWDT